jgi:predicted PurR-regulated permease PerM
MILEEPHSQTATESHPSPFQRRTMWIALTGIAMVSIGALIVFVIGVLADVLRFLQTVLVPLAFAGILAYLLEPLIKRLIARGTPRFRAMVWIFSLFHVLMLFIFISVMAPTLGQLGHWAKKDNRERLIASVTNTMDKALGPLEQFFAPAKESGSSSSAEAEAEAVKDAPPSRWWMEWWADPEHSSMVRKRLVLWLNSAMEGFLGLFGYLVGFIMVPLYLYYFLKEADSIRQNWDQFLPLRASAFKTEVVSVLNEINGYLIAFFRGNMLVSLIDGALVGLALTAFRLPYGALIGLCVAMLGLLPFVGTILCWAAAVIISVIHFGTYSWDSNPPLWVYPLIVTIIFAMVLSLSTLVTAPKIIGEAVGLHPLTVIFSVLFWSLLFGPLLGALLAVPLSASVKVLFRRFIWERSRQGYRQNMDAKM